MFRATVYSSSGGQLYEYNLWYNHSVLVAGRYTGNFWYNHSVLVAGRYTGNFWYNHCVSGRPVYRQLLV